jgi:Metal binding domain of Ada
MYKKLKSLMADDLVFTSLLLCCIALAAFMLGRASVIGTVSVGQGDAPTVRQTTPLQVVGPRASTTATNANPIPSLSDIGETGPIVASKSGTKYHLTSCPGAKQINQENKIFFATAADAVAAGYSPAANCPGL